jgi:hypothetical protein
MMCVSLPQGIADRADVAAPMVRPGRGRARLVPRPRDLLYIESPALLADALLLDLSLESVREDDGLVRRVAQPGRERQAGAVRLGLVAGALLSGHEQFDPPVLRHTGSVAVGAVRAPGARPSFLSLVGPSTNSSRVGGSPGVMLRLVHLPPKRANIVREGADFIDEAVWERRSEPRGEYLLPKLFRSLLELCGFGMKRAPKTR